MPKATSHWDQWAPEEHDLGVRFYLMATGEESESTGADDVYGLEADQLGLSSLPQDPPVRQ